MSTETIILNRYHFLCYKYQIAGYSDDERGGMAASLRIKELKSTVDIFNPRIAQMISDDYSEWSRIGDILYRTGYRERNNELVKDTTTTTTEIYSVDKLTHS